jgi:uncharacterized protein YjbI with pentapeptide repeats
MDQERKAHWWQDRNVRWGAIIIIGVWILIFASIVAEEIGGLRDIGLWDWVGVLIIPVVLTAGAALLTNAQVQRETKAAHLRAQDEALQQYLDQVSGLLVELEQPQKPMSFALFSRLVQARTLTLLLKLDRDRKRQPLKLIAQLELIERQNPLLSLKNAGLDDADLHEVTLLEVSLREADLRGADLTGADLRKSDLTGADLRGADLTRAVLTRACLARANLLPYDRLNPAQLNAPHLDNGSDPSQVDKSSRLAPATFNNRHLTLTELDEADLREADLSGAYLYKANLGRANLARTVLVDTDLRHADLTGAELSGAVLDRADLTDAKVTREQLDACESYDGATMPDGSVHN